MKMKKVGLGGGVCPNFYHVDPPLNCNLMLVEVKQTKHVFNPPPQPYFFLDFMGFFFENSARCNKLDDPSSFATWNPWSTI